MPDIFDQIAAKAGKGDIFDRVAAKMPSTTSSTTIPGAPAGGLPNEAMRAHTQLINQGTNLMNASGYPELANANISGGPPNLRFGGTPPTPQAVENQGQQTLGMLPALGGTVGAAFGGPPGAALGGGAGEATKQLIQRAAGDEVTQTPTTDIAKQSAIMGAAEGAGKYVLGPIVGAVGKQIAKFSGKPASEIAELSQLPKVEEQIRQRIVEGYRSAKATAGAAYPQINTPVNLAPAQSVAQQVSEQMLAHTPPAIVNRMAEMGGAQQLQVTGITPDLNLVLRKIATTNNIPFRDAQQYYSTLGETIAKGRGQLPAETYSSLKAVRETLGDEMKSAAQADGKLAQFTKAQKGWQKLMDDWINPGAPMKQPMSAASKRQFSLFKQFVGDNGANVVKTMGKYNIETRDIQAFQQLGQEAAKTKIADAAELARMGTQAFQNQAGQQAKISALKKGAALAGGSGLIYDILRHLGPTPGAR